MQAVGIASAHISGVSLGAAIGMWLAGKHPEQVKSLSLHSPWHASDEYLRASVNSWRIMAQGLGHIPDVVIDGIFLCCFTPEMYASRPDYVQALSDFVRSRPVQPVDAFMRQTDAVLAHDATGVLGSITAPTQITFGRHDFVCSTRFAAPLQEGIANSELVIFEDCAHAALYENTEAFNARTLDFLQRHSG
jgi:pimeloyl-ACP methyl ester carboxylesterase